MSWNKVVTDGNPSAAAGATACARPPSLGVPCFRKGGHVLVCSIGVFSVLRGVNFMHHSASLPEQEDLLASYVGEFGLDLCQLSTQQPRLHAWRRKTSQPVTRFLTATTCGCWKPMLAKRKRRDVRHNHLKQHRPKLERRKAAPRWREEEHHHFTLPCQTSLYHSPYHPKCKCIVIDTGNRLETFQRVFVQIKTFQMQNSN